MRCSCCGEEVGNASVCPICGSGVAPRVQAPTASTPTTTPNMNSVKPDEPKKLDAADIFERSVNGVLEVETSMGLGSGYMITNELGITNSHVVSLKDGKSCGRCKVKVAGETVAATVVAMGTEKNSEHTSNRDLALLKLDKIPARVKALKLGDSSKVRTGEAVFVIGNSKGEGTCITSGIISDNNRDGQFMYDSATNPGNSGGPVFNAEGLIIATHVRGTRMYDGSKAQGMNGGIPSNAVKEFLAKCGIVLR